MRGCAGCAAHARPGCPALRARPRPCQRSPRAFAAVAEVCEQRGHAQIIPRLLVIRRAEEGSDRCVHERVSAHHAASRDPRASPIPRATVPSVRVAVPIMRRPVSFAPGTSSILHMCDPARLATVALALLLRKLLAPRGDVARADVGTRGGGCGAGCWPRGPPRSDSRKCCSGRPRRRRHGRIRHFEADAAVETAAGGRCSSCLYS